MYKHIYGPVPSRRLGLSLGIDMVPHKVCSLNCVYCECGRTNKLTEKREEYIPYTEIIDELRDYLRHHPAPDFITLSGSGEPTLNSRTGELLFQIKQEFPGIKLAVLTNGTLLTDPQVRRELLPADLVVPSLDAATQEAFEKIDRPVKNLSVESVIEGIALFSAEFHVQEYKEIWLEVFVIEGVNTDEENIRALQHAIDKIQPDRVQLNSLDRPGTELWVKSASRSVLEEMKEKIAFPRVEIIAKNRSRADINSYHADTETAILNALRVRPMTAVDLSESLCLHINIINPYLDVLLNEGKIVPTEKGEGLRGIFYRAKKDN